jgi:xylulokinase
MICGGGAKSMLWKRLVADIINVEVEVPENEEGPSMGGAILAAVACGVYGSVDEASAAIVKTAEVIEPDRELVAKYEDRYRRFAEIYPTCRQLFRKL